VTLNNLSCHIIEIFLGWLRMEYRRNEGSDKDCWKDIVGDPGWISDEFGGDSWNSWGDDGLDALELGGFYLES
jgi:hypothetical protein